MEKAKKMGRDKGRDQSRQENITVEDVVHSVEN
jgi:hypothetical protein